MQTHVFYESRRLEKKHLRITSCYYKIPWEMPVHEFVLVRLQL